MEEKQFVRLCSRDGGCACGISLMGCGAAGGAGKTPQQRGWRCRKQRGGLQIRVAVNPGDDYHAELKLAHIMPIDHPNGLGQRGVCKAW